MNPDTLNLVVFAEQLAALAVKAIAELRGVLSGSSTRQVNDILDEADAKYQEIIANAKSNSSSQPGPTPSGS